MRTGGEGASMDPMRSLFAVLVLVTGLAGALAIVAFAAPQASSLPAYTDGYAGWKKLNAKPFSTPGAHNGVKNVYASKAEGREALPERHRDREVDRRARARRGCRSRSR